MKFLILFFTLINCAWTLDSEYLKFLEENLRDLENGKNSLTEKIDIILKLNDFNVKPASIIERLAVIAKNPKNNLELRRVVFQTITYKTTAENDESSELDESIRKLAIDLLNEDPKEFSANALIILSGRVGGFGDYESSAKTLINRAETISDKKEKFEFIAALWNRMSSSYQKDKFKAHKRAFPKYKEETEDKIVSLLISAIEDIDNEINLNPIVINFEFNDLPEGIKQRLIPTLVKKYPDINPSSKIRVLELVISNNDVGVPFILNIIKNSKNKTEKANAISALRLLTKWPSEIEILLKDLYKTVKDDQATEAQNIKVNILLALQSQNQIDEKLIEELLAILENSHDKNIRSIAINILGQNINNNKSILISFKKNFLTEPDYLNRENLSSYLMDDFSKSLPEKLDALSGYQTINGDDTKNICNAICNLSVKVKENILMTLSDHQYGKTYESELVAYRSLDDLFLIKSNRICNTQNIYIRELLKQYLNDGRFKNFKDLGSPPSGLQSYKNQFELQQIKEFLARKTDFNLTNQEIEKLIAEAKKREDELKNYFPILEDGAGDSGVQTHSHATSLLATLHDSQFYLNKSPPYKKAIDELVEVVKKNPFELPYSMKFYEIGKGPDKVKGSAARAIPVHLALYLKQGPNKNKSNLLQALRNFTEYQNLFIAHTLLYSNTHNNKEDRIAPYYYYSTIPYALAAVEVLKQSSDLSDLERNDLQKIKKELTASLLKIFNQNKFMEQSALISVKSYPGSARYVNSLGGLALLSAYGQECSTDKTKPNFGILSELDITGYPFSENRSLDSTEKSINNESRTIEKKISDQLVKKNSAKAKPK